MAKNEILRLRLRMTIKAVLLGIYLSRAFVDMGNAVSGYEWGYVFPGKAIVTGLVSALLTAFLAALYPAWRAARLDVVKAIRQE